MAHEVLSRMQSDRTSRTSTRTPERTDNSTVVLALTPDQARRAIDHSASLLSSRLDDLGHRMQLDTTADGCRTIVGAVKDLLAEFESQFEALEWGEPSTCISTRLPRERWTFLATELMLSGQDNDTMAGLAERRERIREAEAGAAIYDQLRANR